MSDLVCPWARIRHLMVPKEVYPTWNDWSYWRLNEMIVLSLLFHKSRYYFSLKNDIKYCNIGIYNSLYYSSLITAWFFFSKIRFSRHFLETFKWHLFHLIILVEYSTVLVNQYFLISSFFLKLQITIGISAVKWKSIIFLWLVSAQSLEDETILLG